MAVTADQVQQLYIAYFNRPADFLGLSFQVNQANQFGLQFVADQFSKSPEYLATYAGKGTAEVIDTIYMNLFGRHAEPAGIKFWGDLLNNPKSGITLGNAAITIATGAINDDKVSVANKLIAANAFYASLDTSAEIVGYSGDAANGVLKVWMSGITTQATLDAAITPAALLAVSTAATAAHDGGVVTVSTLTQGVDTLPGSAGNDTFNALTVNAQGAAATTLSAFDSLDGGAGNDTLNIYTTATENVSLAATATIKGVENIHVYNTAAAAAFGDASVFQGATSLWQHGSAVAVTKLAATTTAGFQGISTGALSVTAAATAATASVAFSGVGEAATLAVGGATLATVNVSGTRVDTDASGSVAGLTLAVTAGEDVAAVAVNSSAKTTLTIAEAGTSTVKVSAVDLTGSTGAITYAGDADTATIKGGSGADKLTIATLTVAAATGVTAVSASATSGAGNDTITVTTTGDGLTTIDSGAGDDTVNVTTRGTGKLTVSLGDGVDVFTSAVAVTAADSVDAGLGTDTLSLSLVGSANIGAFSGFELFDAAALGNKTLDIDILATKNTVTEIIASATTGGTSILTNIGDGVGFRATGDMGVGALTLTQKTGGALNLTLDADETAAADTTIDTAAATVTATNATSLKATFDTAFKADIAGETAAGDNVATMTLTAAAATKLDIVSGGALAHNVLAITDTGAKLAAVNVTGDRDLSLTVTGGTKLVTIDASAHTGGLTVSTASLADGGTIKLGSGVDSVTVVTAGTALESLSGFEKAAAVAVSVVAADATAAAAAQADADVLFFGATTAVADSAGGVFTGGTIAKGVLTFSGTGPADLTAAIAIANVAAEAVGETVAFEYLGNSYVFSQGATTDGVIKLVGVTGITSLNEGTTNVDHFFIV